MNEDSRLLRRLQNGTDEEIEKAFEQLYEKYKGLVLFVTARYIDNSADREDLLQEVFIKFFSRSDTVKGSVKSYLAATAKNMAINYVRNNKPHLDIDKYEEELPSYVIDGRDEYPEIIKDMKKFLPKEEIAIIFLHLIEDVSFKEISLRLGLSAGTVKTKYFRALKKYRKAKGEERV